ncbi:MAG: helix-hairpin-helix domain-containing protein [Planctomycetota bacterium]|nr:helix-hairpin-helix domain-containing protein [Planctomycetota bacterium]
MPRTPAGFRLDLNSANWAELSQLEGIGETLARRIVADREQNGRFTRVEDLQRVRGIGPRTVLRLKPWLTTDPRL